MMKVMADTILVVDDDPSILETVSDILEFEGYEVETVTNGQEALAWVQAETPSLVLLDMRMPVLDGWGFSREVRERGLRMPIVVMTAAQNARKWADEIEADGYVSKPFELPDLLEAVRRFRQ